MARDSFIFYRSFYEAIKEIPEESQLKVYKAITNYALNQEEIELNGIPKAIFSLIKPQLDANYKKYENGKQKKSKKEANDKQEESKSETKKGIKTLVEEEKESQRKPKKTDMQEFAKATNDWNDMYDN